MFPQSWDLLQTCVSVGYHLSKMRCPHGRRVPCLSQYSIDLFSFSEVMLLNDNADLTGNLTSLCNKFPELKGASADCGGKTPGIHCPCCVCCDATNATDCDLGDELAIYDPEWITGYSRGSWYSFDNYNITR